MPTTFPKNIGREEIAAIVDRFLAGRGGKDAANEGHATLHASESPAPYQSMTDIGGIGKYAAPEAAPHAEAAPTALESNGGSGARTAQPAPAPQPVQQPGATAQATPASPAQSANGNSRKAVDFVSEDDVRRAVQKGEKIYVNARTIITPSARDMGEPAEVFAKV